MLADGYGPVLDVKVRPEKGSKLALAQSADQLQIEHGEESSLVSGIQIVFDMFWLEDLHLELLNFGSDAVLSRIAQDQAFFDRSLEGVVQHQVKASHGRAAEPRIAMTTLAVDTPILHQLLVELLQVVRGQLGELDIADAGDRVLLDHELVTVGCGNPYVWLCVNVVPASQPCGDSIFVGTADIDTLDRFHCSTQLCLAFRLRLAEDIFDDAFAGFIIVASGVASLPASIGPLTDAALAVGSFLSHLCSPHL